MEKWCPTCGQALPPKCWTCFDRGYTTDGEARLRWGRKKYQYCHCEEGKRLKKLEQAAEAKEQVNETALRLQNFTVKLPHIPCPKAKEQKK